MKDMMASLEKLRADAAEAALIRELATENRSGSYSPNWPTVTPPSPQVERDRRWRGRPRIVRDW